MPFQPLTNYAGYNHVLGSAPCFVHPKNGNIYFAACEQKAGTQQDLSIYRYVAATGIIEPVKRYRGTIDSPSQITMGGAVIAQGGAMFVATSLVIPGVPKVTGTGWQGSWLREPQIDEPWSIGDSDNSAQVDDLENAVAALKRSISDQQQQINEIETALRNIGVGGDGEGLSQIDREALDWLAALRAVLRIG